MRVLSLVALALTTTAGLASGQEGGAPREVVFARAEGRSLRRAHVAPGPAEHAVRIGGRAGRTLAVELERGGDRYRAAVPAAGLQGSAHDRGVLAIPPGERLVAWGGPKLSLDDPRNSEVARAAQLFPDLVVEVEGYLQGGRVVHAGRVRLYPRGLAGPADELEPPALADQAVVTRQVDLLAAGTGDVVLTVRPGTRVWVLGQADRPGDVTGEPPAQPGPYRAERYVWIEAPGPRGSARGLVPVTAVERRDARLGARPPREDPVRSTPQGVIVQIIHYRRLREREPLRDLEGRPVFLLPGGVDVAVTGLHARREGTVWVCYAGVGGFVREEALAPMDDARGLADEVAPE